MKWLTVVGGTPPELLANPPVLELFLPALKADMHLLENYRCVGNSSSLSSWSVRWISSSCLFSFSAPQRPLLACPVTCLDGKDDVPHDLQGQSNDCYTHINTLSHTHFYASISVGTNPNPPYHHHHPDSPNIRTHL